MFIGQFTALVTPFTASGQIDYPTFQALLERQISAQCSGVVVSGTTGEAATLDSQEKQNLIEFAVKTVNGRIKVIAGTAANSTKDAINLTRQARSLGVDGCLIMTPAYIKPTQEGLYQHYRSIAYEVDVPLILYNVPSRTGCDLLPNTVMRLAKIPQIVGIKDATGDMTRVSALLKCGTGFFVLSGDDTTAAPFMMLGGHGVISIIGNLFPAEFTQLCQLIRRGDHKSALAINQRFEELYKLLLLESNPIPVKWCLHALGLLPENELRLPLTALSAELVPVLQKSIKILQGEVKYA